MRHNILLTGRPGIGKSTVIRKVIGVLGEPRVEGFWTSEVRRGTERVGFSINTIDGQQGMLAGTSSYSGPRIGRYTVNVPDIDGVIVPTLGHARESGKIIVIDEIASMELTSPAFAPEVRRCLDTGRVLATLQKKGGSFVQEVGERPDVVLLELTISNRDVIHRDILSMLEQR